MIAGSITTNRIEASDWHLSLCCANLFSLQRQKCSCLMCTCAFKVRREPRQGSFPSLASSWVLFALKHCMTGKGGMIQGPLDAWKAQCREWGSLRLVPFTFASESFTCIHLPACSPARLLACCLCVCARLTDAVCTLQFAGTYTPARISQWRPVQFKVSSMIHPRRMLG